MEDGAYCVIFMCAINVLYILCNKYMLCYVMLCLELEDVTKDDHRFYVVLFGWSL